MDMKAKLIEARTAYTNLSPLVKASAGPVFTPLLDLLASLVHRVNELEGAANGNKS